MSMSCKKVSEIVSQSLDRDLSLRERLAVYLHLAMCRMCSNYRRQLLFMRRATRQLSKGSKHAGTALPDAAKAHIQKKMEESGK